mgnify:FL=1
MLMKKKTNPLEPPYRKCSICNDKKGKITNKYCLDNPKNPNYKDYSDGYLDCWGFIRSNETEKEWKERVSIKTNK